MKFLLFNWDDVPDGTQWQSDEDFEKVAEKYGTVIESVKEFEQAFNDELFSVHTHQLRIIE